MLGSLTLAVEPVYLVKEGGAGTGMSLPVLAAGFGGFLVVLAACWALYALKVRARRDLVEHAFVVLCRGMRVPRSARGLVRRLAQCHGHASPVALLLSEHAMRSAVRDFERGSLSAADKRSIERLRLGFGL
jgi:hypothetical protein